MLQNSRRRPELPQEIPPRLDSSQKIVRELHFLKGMLPSISGLWFWIGLPLLFLSILSSTARDLIVGLIFFPLPYVGVFIISLFESFTPFAFGSSLALVAWTIFLQNMASKSDSASERLRQLSMFLGAVELWGVSTFGFSALVWPVREYNPNPYLLSVFSSLVIGLGLSSAALGFLKTLSEVDASPVLDPGSLEELRVETPSALARLHAMAALLPLVHPLSCVLKSPPGQYRRLHALAALDWGFKVWLLMLAALLLHRFGLPWWFVVCAYGLQSLGCYVQAKRALRGQLPRYPGDAWHPLSWMFDD